tara:strand:+ start:2935 stop:3756 length:822 start_codon:yes stop_codon:yes gene_type:complete
MIDELCKNIRELCNHPWKGEVIFQDKVKWNKFWTSLDAIEDSELAIIDYLNLPEFNASQRGYLYIYGIMQALTIQQDALKNLSEALFNEKINFKTDYPELYIIKEFRNDSVGHPTNRGNGRSFHYIGRPSIKKSGFRLLSYFPKTGEESKIININVLECIKIQNGLVAKKLKQTMKNLESDFEQHKAKFKDKKLADIIHPTTSYHFTKLYENINRNYDLVELNFDTIKETYDKIKVGITDRYFSLSALSGIELITERLDYIFTRVRRDLIEDK